MLAHVLHDSSRELAPIEVVSALLGQPLERLGQVGHHEAIPGDEPVAVVAVDRPPFVRVPENRVENRVQVGLRLGHFHAVPCERIAGSSRSRQGRDENCLCASPSPATAPGTAQEAAPMRKACDDSGVKSTATESISVCPRRRSPRPGTATK